MVGVQNAHHRDNRPLLLGLVVGAFLLRFIALGVFPDIAADEGLWTNSSKNYVAFGDWFMDQRTHMLLSPVFHAASVAVFKLVGPSIAAARAISAVAGTLSVLLLYRLVQQLTRCQALALTTAILFGVDEFSVLMSRVALIESLELSLGLATGALLLQRSRWAVGAAAGTFALALLTKLNIAFLGPVFVAFLLFGSASAEGHLTRSSIWRTVAFALASVVLAGAVYGALYAAYPDRFVAAFRFELDGVHFESISHPFVRMGRFGLDPIQASRTVIGLFRESPFLLVLAACGAAVGALARPRGVELFGPWLVVGLVFFLGQMYQPLHYFYLVSPAFAFFAAVAVQEFGAQDAQSLRRRLHAAVLAVYLAFNLSYVSIGAVANHGTKLREVVAWARAHTRPADRIMAAGYFCTDLPNRCYAYYHLARDSRQLMESIRTYRIDYVIYDDAEWRRDLGPGLAARFAPVQSWDFGVVYRVTTDP